jgi:hypothetical protein
MDEPKVVNPEHVDEPHRHSHFREENFQLPADWEAQRAKFEAFDAQHRKAILRKVVPP